MDPATFANMCMGIQYVWCRAREIVGFAGSGPIFES